MQIKNIAKFFRDNPIPMWIYDPEDYYISDVNQAMAKLYGYSREKMLSFTLLDLCPEEEVSKLKTHLAQMDNETLGNKG